MKALHRLSRKFPRLGSPKIHAKLVAEGWRLNHKRVERLWAREGLQVPRKQRKRRRLGSSENGCIRQRASRPNDVWSYDFLFDRTEAGRRLKILVVLDEFTRECLAIRVANRITSTDVLGILAALMAERGAPKHVRSDNGPEFIARKVRRWLKRYAIDALFIEPGSPWENGYVESFNAQFRSELLNRELFPTQAEARYLIENYRREYNEERPHGALKMQTPKQFATHWSEGGIVLRTPLRSEKELCSLS